MWRLLRLTLLIPTMIAAYLLAAVAGALLPGKSAPVSGPPDIRIGLVAGPIHYDFLLPLRPDVRDRFGFAETILGFDGRDWLVVGWGSRAFYTTTGTYADVSLGSVWQAASGDRSVMHLDTYRGLPDPAAIRWVDLSGAQYTALLDALLASFAQTDLGSPELLPVRGLTATDAFWTSDRRFHLGQTCNVWVGEMLRAAGLRFGGWTPTTYSIRLSLWWFAA